MWSRGSTGSNNKGYAQHDNFLKLFHLLPLRELDGIGKPFVHDSWHGKTIAMLTPLAGTFYS
jgi:hypothetical protein